jgi:cytidine deaminase
VRRGGQLQTLHGKLGDFFMTDLPDHVLSSLIDAARKARLNAHAPYSKFKVGAAVLDARGIVSVGCNMENGAYPLGTCAEAVALGAMVAAGGRECRVIVIVGGGDTLITPCGGCRQRIAELAVPGTEVYCAADTGEAIEKMSVEDLLPNGFRL